MVCFMPTPAVNYDTSLRNSVKYTEFYNPYCGLGPYVYDNFSYVENRFRQRPASVTVPPSSFRKPTNWSHEWHNVRMTSGNTTLTRNKPGCDYNTRFEFVGNSFWIGGARGPGAITRPLVPSPPSSVKNRCEISALNKLRLGEFDLGVFLAESNETIHMFADYSRRISKAVQAFRRRNPKNVWKAIVGKSRKGRRNEQATKEWLALQYGWTPLMSDLWSACGDVERLNRTVPRLIHVKSRASDRTSVTWTEGSYLFSYSRIWVAQYEHKCSCRLWYVLSDPKLALLSSLGLTDPSHIVWEKVPYSFVVDWFAPVGQWLQALTADVGFSFYAGCYSTKSDHVSEDVRMVKDPAFDILDGTSYRVVQGKFTRLAYTSSPSPGLYVKNPLSPKHIANGLSLLVQAFK